MNVLFLDFDGVIVGVKGTDAVHAYPPAVDALNNLIERTNSKVVVSSCWRIGWSVEKLQQTLDEFGVKCAVIGKTKSNVHRDDGKHMTRGEEIAEWLGENGFSFHVTSFIVVDDEINDMTNLPQDKILHVSGGWFHHGLTQEKVDKFLAGK